MHVDGHTPQLIAARLVPRSERLTVHGVQAGICASLVQVADIGGLRLGLQVQGQERGEGQEQPGRRAPEDPGQAASRRTTIRAGAGQRRRRS